ncbi:RDD family protein [Actinoplanes sp. NBC_00393]|uniref:RDD family protein n=1 Tax=Actinoplanes sp. NBC_00393 TaxID=2975953 RepID=UPI002E1BDF3C
MTYPPSDPYAQVPQQAYPTPAAYGAPAPYGAPQAVAAYAGWWQRVGAYLVDGLVYVPFVLLGVFLGQGTDEVTGATTMNALYPIFVLLGLVAHGYNRWFLAGRTGQSWGRKALGIRLVGINTGQPIGGGKAFLRDLAHFVDSISCYVGWLFPIWDAKKQTFADKIVNTVVVR